MLLPGTKRIRDPIHNLIVFNNDDDTDALAWKLINTPEFQRLRRIKQLGFSEHVFPGATHSRLAHCIGVYRNARKLVGVIDWSWWWVLLPFWGPFVLFITVVIIIGLIVYINVK